jgi:hypothetical protein
MGKTLPTAKEFFEDECFDFIEDFTYLKSVINIDELKEPLNLSFNIIHNTMIKFAKLCVIEALKTAKVDSDAKVNQHRYGNRRWETNDVSINSISNDKVLKNIK